MSRQTFAAADDCEQHRVNDMGRLIGAKPGYWSSLEAGRYSYPRSDTITRIADALGVSVDELTRDLAPRSQQKAETPAASEGLEAAIELLSSRKKLSRTAIKAAKDVAAHCPTDLDIGTWTQILEDLGRRLPQHRSENGSSVIDIDSGWTYQGGMSNAPTSPRRRSMADLAICLRSLATARTALCRALTDAEHAHLDSALKDIGQVEVTARLAVREAYRAAQRATPKNLHMHWHLQVEESYFYAVDAETLETLALAYEGVIHEDLGTHDEYATATWGALDESGLLIDGTRPEPPAPPANIEGGDIE